MPHSIHHLWYIHRRLASSNELSWSNANTFPKKLSGVGFFFGFPNGRAVIRSGMQCGAAGNGLRVFGVRGSWAGGCGGCGWWSRAACAAVRREFGVRRGAAHVYGYARFARMGWSSGIFTSTGWSCRTVGCTRCFGKAVARTSRRG